jgi:glycosyltransferase involved in cell wall biosynthesis
MKNYYTKLLMISGDRSLAEGKRGAFYNTLEEFHKYWDRVDIICPKIQNSKIKMQNDNVKFKIFENVYIHPSSWPLIAQPLWILKKGRQIYAEQKFNLMTVHEYPPFYNGIGARLLWNKIKTPYILEIMHVPGHPKASSLKERFYRALFKIFICWDAVKAKAIRVINQKQTPEFLKAVGISEDRIKYIPAFYIDLDVFRPLAVEKKYDLVFAARLEKNKGISLLLKAVRFSISNFQFPMKLLIIGSGPLKNELIRYVEKNGLKDNVFFSGWLETLNDVAQAYNSAKIFINPSLNEGGPRVALEAIACGLPVITTKVGLMPDIIRNGENGLFMDWTSNDMTEKTIGLLKDKELQNKFSEAGLKLVKQFERKDAIKNYADKLQSLI